MAVIVSLFVSGVYCPDEVMFTKPVIGPTVWLHISLSVDIHVLRHTPLELVIDVPKDMPPPYQLQV